MPELPDITIYVEALERRIVGERLVRVSVRSPFLLRTFDPPLESAHGRMVREVRRLGKRGKTPTTDCPARMPPQRAHVLRFVT